MTTKESDVDVRAVMDALVARCESLDRAYGISSESASNARAARAAVAEVFEAARNASAVLSHAYHTQIRGELEQDAHDAYQRLDTALRNAGVKV